jgi:endoglycosylceramidase
MRRLAALLVVAVSAALCPALPAGAREHHDHRGRHRHHRDGLPALHAVDGAAPAIVDAEGRQVTLRGVNVNSLGDYFQADPALATVVPVTGADWDRMAAHGFDVVRLLVSWSRLEPEPGRIDHAYLREISRAVHAAAARGIYSVIDMHQDAWGKYIASAPDAVCTDGKHPAIGWDGAPAWATITDGADPCQAGSRELSEAVLTAWDSFYADRDGIMTHLVHVWKVLARRFADEPAVAGFDVLNEPNHGHRADFADRLGQYYGRAIAAIRAGEREHAGLSHIVFFETTVYGSPVSPGFSTDTNLVFAPHNYAESIGNLPIEGVFDYFHALALGYGTPMWIGEYGWFARYAAKEDALLTAGDAWWQWRQACGDPHSVGTFGGTPDAVLVHFQRNGCPGDHDLGVVPEWSCTWRAYPRAVPGRLTSRVSTCDGALDFTGTTAHSGTADVWYPGDRAPSVSGAAGHVRRHRIGGGWDVTFRVRGSYQVHVGA